MRHWRTSVGVGLSEGLRGKGASARGRGERGAGTFVQVGAVVVRLDAAAGVGGVDVECIQMSTDLLDGAEVLEGRKG